MRNKYFDMKTGLVNLMGIRFVKKFEQDDYSFHEKAGHFGITVQYKGLHPIIFMYNNEITRDNVYNDLMKELIG